MSSIKYEELLRNCVVDNKIRADHLCHIPKLKDCEHWEEAIYLGKIKYKFKFSIFDGALIKYFGKIYYITSKQVVPLAQVYKWKNLNNTIEVIE